MGDVVQLSKVGKTEKPKRRSPNARKYSEVRSREHLLSEEVEAMREAIKKRGGRHAHRDATLILVIYRHGLRVEEAANLRWEQIDFATGEAGDAFDAADRGGGVAIAAAAPAGISGVAVCVPVESQGTAGE